MVSGPSPAKHILIVEDDDTNRHALSLVLENTGCTVSTAANGLDVLERLHAGPQPDLILLDLIMPLLSGWEFRERQLREPALASIPVVVLSAVGEAAEHADALGGVVGYLQKPVDEAALLAAVERFTVPHRPEVLVVDDEPFVRTLLDAALRHFGFSVRLAAGGWEAVDVYRRHHGSISLALLDVRMPDLDGPHTLAAMQKLNPLVRSCFMSGQMGDYSHADLLARGATQVFPKPFGSVSQLTQALWKVATCTSPHQP
jgi:CheY-like chemotaxis protein